LISEAGMRQQQRSSFKDSFVAANAESLRTASWFLQDFVFRYRLILGWITLLAGAAAALQGGTLFLLRFFFTAEALVLPGMSGDEGWRIDADNSVTLLAIVTFVALGAGALLIFVQGRSILGLWRTYQIHATNALLHEVYRASRRGAIDEAAISASPVSHGLRQSQRLGMFARVVAGGISPTLRFIAFSIFAISVNPLLTLVLFLAAVPSGGLAMFFFARQSSRTMRSAEELARDASKEMDNRLKAAAAGKFHPVDEREAKRSPWLQRVGLMVRRFVWVENARFATAQITIVTLTAVILVAGYSGSAVPIQWSDVLLYVLSLLLAFTQLVALASLVSRFGRFYPAIERHKALLEILREAKSPSQFQRRIERRNLASPAKDEDEEDVV
jgi:ABC-type multidrug transport system fused ATPase/permease subunit